MALVATRAGAHPQAAEAPVFTPGDCVTVVDTTAQSELLVPYTLPFDDATLGYADIPLSDAKTHQFFAFAGAVVPADLRVAAYPFDPARRSALIPEWISTSDVDRSVASAALAEGGSMFSADSVPGGTVLDNDADLTGLFLPITSAAMRVPITQAQAALGVRWDLTQVPAGLYTIAGYVFSPPYNGWSVRPGIVKLTTPGDDRPALVVGSVSEFVFPYQGRRVSLCSNAPPGTRLTGSYRLDYRPEEPWIPFAMRELATGRSELCFRPSSAAAAGLYRVRFDLVTPRGTRASFYSPDSVTLLQGNGQCTPADTICCDFGNAPATSAAGQGADAAPVSAATSEHGGCSAQSRSATGAEVWLAVLCLLLLARRSRTRSSGFCDL